MYFYETCYTDNAKELEDHKQKGKISPGVWPTGENLLATNIQKWQHGEHGCGVLISWVMQFILVHANQIAQ